MIQRNPPLMSSGSEVSSNAGMVTVTGDGEGACHRLDRFVLCEATRRADDSRIRDVDPGFVKSPTVHRLTGSRRVHVCELERLAESLPSRMEAPRRSPPTF